MLLLRPTVALGLAGRRGGAVTEKPTKPLDARHPDMGIAWVRVEFVECRVVPLVPVEVRDSSGHRGGSTSPLCSEPSSSLEEVVRRLEAVAAALVVASREPDQPGGMVWLTHEEVCERLRVHRETVKAAMLRSESLGLDQPWVNFGSEARPQYLWRVASVDAWWAEVHGSGKGRKRRGSGRQKAGTGGLRALLNEGGK